MGPGFSLAVVATGRTKQQMEDSISFSYVYISNKINLKYLHDCRSTEVASLISIIDIKNHSSLAK